MTTASGSTANVFVLSVAPAPGVAPADLGRTLIGHAKGFALASRPSLAPALFVHRILESAAPEHLWEIVFEGLDIPHEEHAADEHLGDAILAEARARLSGVGEIVSSAAYADLLLPPPGPGVAQIAPGQQPPAAAPAGAALPGWDDYAHDAGTKVAGGELSDALLRRIEQNRAVIPAEPGLKHWGAGHMYGGGDKAHIAYLNAYFAQRAARASAADRRKIQAFSAIQAREGSTAAINTYDNQIVTWGTGWGGRGGLGKVMERAVANRAVHDLFGSCGVRYRGKNVYDVVDLEAKRVVTGTREALEAIRRSVPLLYMLIDAARSEATRDAVTEAQLLAFMATAADISGSDAVATQALFNLIAHLKHWAPGYVMGCLEWALPQAGDGPSPDRDRRLAELVGRYFYGKAHHFKWIPDWKQFQLYWKHMKDDGLDCLGDPFIQASRPPAEDPFAAALGRASRREG